MGRCDRARRQLRLKAGPTKSDRNRPANSRRAKRSNTLSVHFSSKARLRATPWDFFNKLDAEFGFTLDVCALPKNAKCKRFFTPEEDGLEQDWRGVCWMNPPYGREIGKWVAKAYESAQQGATVVCLLPARTDTAWWHGYVLEAFEVRFVRGRLRFAGAGSSAPFPSVVVVFRPWPSPLYLKAAA